MQSDYTGHVTQAEWRWVVLMSSLLLGIAALPFVWVTLSASSSGGQTFMGVLHQHIDGASKLANMTEGRDGNWLTHYLQTPESHPATLNGVFYALLGQVARLTAISPLVIFHMMRGGVSLLMYLALYHLAADIWIKQRPRRLFFILVTIGSGLSWILIPFLGAENYFDLAAPEAYPFYSSLVNVHYPLAITFLTLMAGMIIVIFRPGEVEEPTVNNGGLTMILLSLLLAFVYPLAMIPITLAFAICVGMDWYKSRSILRPQLYWFMWFMIPALPMLAYYIAVLRYNTVVGTLWLQENDIAPAPIPLFVIGLGATFLIALPGIYRGLRHLEPDGDRFMAIWLVVMVLLVYISTAFRQRFAIAMMIPVAYFAARAVEDFWVFYIPRRLRRRVVLGLLPLLVITYALVLFVPTRHLHESFIDKSELLLDDDYVAAYNWLRSRARSSSVILAAPEVSLWIPARVGARVVYASARQTAEPDVKKQAVLVWYQEDDLKQCEALLRGAYHYDRRSYTVNYVLVGPRERAIGDTVCTEALTLVKTLNSVQIFAYYPADSRP